DQSGDNNRGYITQTNNHESTEASVYASGNSNTQTIYQNRVRNGSWAYAEASGNRNNATITQEGLNHGGASVVQSASRSTTIIDQGESVWGRRTSEGSSQWAHVTQNSGLDHFVYVNQRG